VVVWRRGDGQQVVKGRRSGNVTGQMMRSVVEAVAWASQRSSTRGLGGSAGSGAEQRRGVEGGR
jgi:hypothetical protein